jgi:hypothetical protein
MVRLMAQPKLKPVVKPAEDPAGLDKLILSAGKATARFVEGLIQQKIGQSVQLWDGKDGLGAVMEEQVRAAGIPNKRLPELVTPRAVLQQSGLLTPKRKRQRRVRG